MALQNRGILYRTNFSTTERLVRVSQHRCGVFRFVVADRLVELVSAGLEVRIRFPFMVRDRADVLERRSGCYSRGCARWSYFFAFQCGRVENRGGIPGDWRCGLWCPASAATILVGATPRSKCPESDRSRIHNAVEQAAGATRNVRPNPARDPEYRSHEMAITRMVARRGRISMVERRDRDFLKGNAADHESSARR